MGQRLRFPGRYPHAWSSRRSFPITWRQYDVVNLEPLKIKLPDYPFVGAVALTLRDEQNHRFAANFVNLVVKPDRPLPRIKRRNDHDVTIRFAPRDFARQEWSDPAQAASRQGLRARQGLFRVPDRGAASRSSRHIPNRFTTSSRQVPRPSASASTGPSGRTGRIIPRRTRLARGPRRSCVLVNGRPVDRITLPDDAADARGVLSHLAGVEQGSHGELVDGMIVLTDRDRAVLAAGGPMVLRLAVPDDAPAEAAASASSVRRPAKCRWTRRSRSIRGIPCPLTLASIPTDRWPCRRGREVGVCTVTRRAS